MIGDSGPLRRGRSLREIFRQHATSAFAAFCGLIFARTAAGGAAIDWLRHQPRIAQVTVMAIFIVLFVGALSLFDIARRRYSRRRK